MKDSWVARTKRFFHDDLNSLKLRKQIQRQKSAPVLSHSYNNDNNQINNLGIPSKRPATAKSIDQPVVLPVADIEHNEIQPRPTDLLKLPYELLNQVVLQLRGLCFGNDELQSLLSLSMTCRTLRDICVPHIFDSGNIEYHNSGPVPRASQPGYSTALQLYTGQNATITRNLCRLRLHQRQGSINGADSNVIQDFVPELQCALQQFERLHFIHLDPPTIPHTIILRNLQQRLVHVALDLRFSRANVAEVLPELAAVVRDTSFDWSLATVSTPNVYDLLQAVLHSQRAKAIFLDTTSFQHQQDFPLAPGTAYPSLEELSLFRRNIERRRRVTALPPSSIIVQICDVLPDLINLRRLRLEGARLCEEVQAVLPLLRNLEELSLSAFDRGAFHIRCNFDEEYSTDDTHDMSWLQLPKLKQLDLRFICRHFDISQLVPPGLKGLRIQFYSPEHHLSLDQLNWLGLNCPDLERLEISVDLGKKIAVNENDANEVRAKIEHVQKMLLCLEAFKNLRTLRLFPVYWRDERFVPQPMPSLSWPLDTFRLLKSKCNKLSALNIAISNGEYQPHLIPRLEPEKRPLRFSVEQHGKDDLLRYRYGFPDSAQMAQRFVDRGKAISPRQIVLVRPELSLADHSSGWVFPPYETVFTNSRAWLATPQGQMYLDELENGCFT